MSNEQRREKRIETRQRLWCEGQDSPRSAETRDVSQNGMFIVAEDAPDVGSQLKVTLQDQDGEVTLNMEVVWRGKKTEDNKTGVGMRIVGFDKGRDVYERFIHRHMRPSTLPEDPQRSTLRPSRIPATTLRPSRAPGTGSPTLRPSRAPERARPSEPPKP